MAVVRKLFWVWNYDKEEKWLNEMASQGLLLTSVGHGKYEFEACEPGEYIVRMEYLKKIPIKSKNHEYISFVEETGAERINSSGARWAYFKKRSSEGNFEIFSDYSSRIKHIERIQSGLSSFTIYALICTVISTLISIAQYILNERVALIFILSSVAFFVGCIINFIGIHKLQRKRNELAKEKQFFEG